MGRKPKTIEGVEVSEPTPSEIIEIPETFDVESSDITISVEPLTPPMPEYPDISQYMAEEMEWARGEIERCNDYIFAKADLDRRFSVYRDELYEYRYKFRQMIFVNNYPHINPNSYPKRPDIVIDI